MVALVKGQNTALTADRLRITVESAVPLDLSALLLAATGKVRSDADFAFYNQPTAAGVVWRSGSDRQHLEVDLAALPPDVERVIAVASLDDRAFGATPAPTARLADAGGGAELGVFEMAGLREERAVIAWEVYRRGDAWKVRAVGQGYAGGLAELVTAHGIAVEGTPAPPPTPVNSPTERVWPSSVPPATIPEMTIRPPSIPIEPPPRRQEDDERLYDVLWKIFEDAARATAALRSATGFADDRVGSSRVDLQACKLEYSIVSPK